ncbi:type I restriction endonuclease [Phormidesmis sp. 146-35]
MVQITAITDAITTLAEAENQFGLRRTEDEQFFKEWIEGLPDLTDVDREALDTLRRRYVYHRTDGDLLEGTVSLLMASPLLAVAGFYDPPFKVKAEPTVQITLDDDEEVLRGRIDVLVMQNQFWVVILESKKTTLAILAALPQALTYLMASPHPDQPGFGMITNGDDILFVKLTQGEVSQYSLSRVFAPFTSSRELYNATQVLRRIGQVII